MKTFPATVLAFAAALGLSAAWAGEGAMPARMPVNATFQRMTALVGDWKGTSKEGTPALVTYTLVSDGSALMERLKPTGPDGKVEEMISMYAPDGDGVMMTHYCSMHNQPRMRAAAAASGPIAFTFVDATNLESADSPHMDHVTLNLAGDKLSQDWTYKAGSQAQGDTFTYARVK
jgi:hypothetical protein